MRPALATAALGICALSVACDPLAEVEHFDVSGEQVVSIPGKNIVSDPLSVVPVGEIGDALSRSISQTFENQGVDRNDVDRFSPKEATIEVLGPQDRNGNFLQDLRFLDSVRIIVSAPGIEDALIGESAAGAFAEGVTRYTFSVDPEENLKEHLIAEQMTLTVDAQANDRPTLGCDVRFATVFSVEVNLVGFID